MPEDKLGFDFYKRGRTPSLTQRTTAKLRRDVMKMMLPDANQRVDGVNESGEIAFREPGNGAEIAGLLNRFLLARVARGYDRYTAKFSLLANPSQNGKGTSIRQIQVQHDNSWERIDRAVAVDSYAFQIEDRFVSITRDLQIDRQCGFPQTLLKLVHVIGAILDHKHHSVFD